MNFLLDTHTLIWFLNGDEKLSRSARIAIENSENTNFVSIGAIWEIAVIVKDSKTNNQRQKKLYLKPNLIK